MHVVCSMVLVGPGAAVADGIEAITNPSKDVTLSFVRPGKIAEILAEEGRIVKRGEVLVRQDDAAERQQLAQLKAQAQDKIRIKAAQAKLDQSELDEKKIKQAKELGVATELELEHAQLEVTIASLSLDLAVFQNKQDELKHKETVLHVERMRIVSPINGRVERIFIEAGESVDSLAQVIRVVHIDPLRIEVQVPLGQARKLKAGQAAWVAFDKGGRERTRGTIAYVSSVADAASETLMVRVEAPNPSARPAGERVYVSFVNTTGDVTRTDRSNPIADKTPPKKEE